MPLQPFPFSSQHAYPTTSPHQWVIPDGGRTSVADADGVHAHRYNIFYQGQISQVFVQSVGGCTYRVISMLPAVYGPTQYDIGDLVTSGTVTGQTVSLGPLQYGHYAVLFDVADVDANWGTSAGKCFTSMLRRHSGFPHVDELFSTFNQSLLEWKPNGYGLTNVDVNNGVSRGVSVDMIARAVCSMGVGRVSIVGSVTGNFPPLFDANTGSTTPAQRLSDAVDFFTNAGGPYWLTPSNDNWVDPVRPRAPWVAFPSYFSTFDGMSVPSWANIYPATPDIDATKLFIKLTSGSVSGAKLQVYYPDSSTLVETYDNLANGAAASTAANINGNGGSPSDYIRVFTISTGAFTAISTPTAIGNHNRSQITACVQALYPLGVKRYEGPWNEPNLGGAGAIEAAHQFWLFHAAVADAGFSDAKPIGPTPVDIKGLTNLDSYFGYLDGKLTKDQYGFGFHDYDNFYNGDTNQGRNYIENALAIVKSHNLDGIEMWQTEANQSLGDESPVYMPAKKRMGIAHTLLWEQYGIPRERNPHWYDSRNFWQKPWALVDNNNSLMGEAVLYSVLGQETFGKNHHHRMDFGSVPANAVFSGSVYGDPLTGSTAVMWCHSYMPNSTVTLGVLGTTSPLTVVDCCGNTAQLTPDGSGMITVRVPEFPTYVRLPAGVCVYVDHVRNWSTPLKASVSRGYSTATLGGSTKAQIVDDAFKVGATSNESAFAKSGTSLPDKAEITWSTSITPVERVLAFCGPAVDDMPGLLQYSVQTYDGSSWTTQPVRLDDGTFGTTVTHTVPASVLHPDGASSTGTTREQYWREQWIEDIEFQNSISTFKGFRLVVGTGGLSFGGAVDSAADAIMSGYGRSSGSDPRIGLQEIMVLSTATPTASGLSAPANVAPATIQGV